jgi:hypothetical protein
MAKDNLVERRLSCAKKKEKKKLKMPSEVKKQADL